MKRRNFMKRSLVGAGGILTGFGAGSAVAQAQGKHDAFATVTLGETGIEVSKVGMGTGVSAIMRESNLTRFGKEHSVGIIRTAFDRGVRFFDAADSYGTHPFVSTALKSIPRKEYALSTKIWWAEGGIPEKERAPADVLVERFMRELNTDYIDLVQLHCLTASNWNTQLSDYMEKLAQLKQKGVIRAHGVSCHSLNALKTAAKEPWVDSVHARINPYAASMDVETPEEVSKVVTVLKEVHDQGKGVVGMKIIGEGRFGTSDEKRNRSIGFALNLGCLDTMVIGFEKESHIDDVASRVEKATVSNNPAA